MTPFEIDSALNAFEVQMAVGDAPDIVGTGFWPAVRAVKGDPELIEQFADRIGEIDRVAFKAWARLVIPVWFGTTVAVIGALIGLGLVSAAAFIEQWSAIVFLAGTGLLIGTTHGLGHLVVGRIGGIRFSAWFIGRGRPQPGVKTDYATYLRASPRTRAWMHASGAIVTKLIPFLVLPLALAVDAIPGWVGWVLLALGVFQIITDILWSTKSSDWAKFKREMKHVVQSA